MSTRHLAGCDTRGANWICAAGCPVAAQRTEKETTMPVPTAEKDAEALGDLIARHDAYRVNEDGWTVCICGHIAEDDDDDGSHARHVAAMLTDHLASVWSDGYGAGSSNATDGWVRPGTTRNFNPYAHVTSPAGEGQADA